MTQEIKGTRNYSATVIKVPKLKKAENSDNLYLLEALGITSIVDSSWVAREGFLALMFPAEVQISDEILARNNLYSDPLLNADSTEKGYVGRNRRVRAVKLRGNISNGLVLPMIALGERANGLAFKEGDVFDTLNGEEICRKFVVATKESGPPRAQSKVTKAFKRVTDAYLPAHFETGQWLREQHNVAADETLIITQKLHGTSCRLGNVPVRRSPSWFEKLLVRLGLAEFI